MSWGGKREGAGSGGPRPNAGRPRKIWNSGGPGTLWVAEIGKPGDAPTETVWTVLSVGVDEIEFQNTSTGEIIVLRKD